MAGLDREALREEIGMNEWSKVVDDIQSVPENEKRKIEILGQLVEAIIARRRELGLTQEEVAQRSGIRI